MSHVHSRTLFLVYKTVCGAEPHQTALMDLGPHTSALSLTPPTSYLTHCYPHSLLSRVGAGAALSSYAINSVQNAASLQTVSTAFAAFAGADSPALPGLSPPQPSPCLARKASGPAAQLSGPAAGRLKSPLSCCCRRHTYGCGRPMPPSVTTRVLG